MESGPKYFCFELFLDTWNEDDKQQSSRHCTRHTKVITRKCKCLIECNRTPLAKQHFQIIEPLE